jgi:ABC-2 type transport system ATP-binding protein
LAILSLQHITKFYGRLQALDNVSFEVPEGAVFGILGPNGSGKTTMLGIITDVLKADNGGFQWFDQTPDAEQRKKIGTLLETPNFYHYLSAYDNLLLTATIRGKGHEQIDEVLQQVGLLQRKKSKFSTFSLGMKQRLAIGAALLGNPPVLVLDEPTNGLDPMGISEIRMLIRQLAEGGKTIIMASHLLDEVEKVCSHVAILKLGKLITAGAVNDVLVNEDSVELGCNDLELLQKILVAFPVACKSVKVIEGKVQVVFDGKIGLDELNKFCFEHGIVLNHLQIKRKSLEAKFIELTA